MDTQVTVADIDAWTGFDSTDGGRFVRGMARTIARTVLIDEPTLYVLSVEARGLYGEAKKATDAKVSGRETRTNEKLTTKSGGEAIKWGKLEKPPLLANIAAVAEAVYVLRGLGVVDSDYSQKLGGTLLERINDRASILIAGTDIKRQLSKE